MGRRSRSIAVMATLAVCLALAPAGRTQPAGGGGLGPALAALERGDHAEAERRLAAITSGVDAVAARVALARVELRTGRYARAAETAAAAAALSKEAKIAAAPVRAEALAATGRTAEAIAVVREVADEPTAHRARVVLGELLIRTGKRAEAVAVLNRLFEAYQDDVIKETDAEGLALVARAAHLMRKPKNANKLFDEAEAAGARAETLLWRADLHLEKHDPGTAGELVKAAEKLAPGDARVVLARARVGLAQTMNFDAADQDAAAALRIDPGLAGAHAVAAGLALRDLDLVAADSAVARGLAVNPDDLELLSLKAAVRFLADDRAGYDALKQRVLALDPEYSTFFVIVGEYAEWEHRYDDLIVMMREAIKIDAKDPVARAALGINLLRAGDERAGVAALRESFALDPYHVLAYNTLDLYEHVIPAEYVSVPGKRFTMRYHKDERAVLERYVPRLLDEAWTSMARRYRFAPKTPVGIELYADSVHFSVRTSGLPNVGIQGVCFGRTLAALSPNGGAFNWGNVVWHELAHVFAIQMSRNHVPRWFTEGLAEYEGSIARPEWQREEDLGAYRALRAGRIPSIENLNRAFTHADDVEDVVVAYYTAGQLVQFMVGEFGFDKVVSMLPRWGKGERTPEVIRGALGVSPAEVDKRFRAWLELRLARYAAGAADEYAARMKQGDAAEAKRDLAGMKAAYAAASRADPSQAEPLQALYDLAHRQRDDPGALDALRALSLLDQHDRRVWGALLDGLVASAQWAEARRVGASAMFVDPGNPAVHRAYAEALMNSGDVAGAAFELESATLTLPRSDGDPLYAAAMYDQLAAVYDKLKKKAQAKKARRMAITLRGGSAP